MRRQNPEFSSPRPERINKQAQEAGALAKAALILGGVLGVGAIGGVGVGYELGSHSGRAIENEDGRSIIAKPADRTQSLEQKPEQEPGQEIESEQEVFTAPQILDKEVIIRDDKQYVSVTAQGAERYTFVAPLSFEQGSLVGELKEEYHDITNDEGDVVPLRAIISETKSGGKAIITMTESSGELGVNIIETDGKGNIIAHEELNLNPDLNV